MRMLSYRDYDNSDETDEIEFIPWDYIILAVDISISISISIIYLPSGTRGVVAQSPEPGAHDKSD